MPASSCFAVLTSVTVALGCSVPAIGRDGWPCPCTAGYVCDDARQLCIPDPRSLDATACDDPLADRAFCDGFELPLETGWDLVSSYPGAVTAIGAQAYRGDGALDLRTSDGARSFVTTRGRFVLREGSAYVRAFVRIPSDNALPRFLIGYLFGEDGVAFGVDGDGHWYVTLAAPGPPEVSGPLEALRGQWQCVELAVEIASELGAIHLHVDGLPAVDVEDVPTATGALDTLSIGLQHTFDSAAANHAQIDEVVVDDRPIGCGE